MQELISRQKIEEFEVTLNGTEPYLFYVHFLQHRFQSFLLNYHSLVIITQIMHNNKKNVIVQNHVNVEGALAIFSQKTGKRLWSGWGRCENKNVVYYQHKVYICVK